MRDRSADCFGPTWGTEHDAKTVALIVRDRVIEPRLKVSEKIPGALWQLSLKLAKSGFAREACIFSDEDRESQNFA